jgi:hypothetical protein
MEGEAAIAEEVMDLRRVVADEDIEAIVCEDRADRMDTRATVLPNCSQIAEPDAELIEESPSCLGHIGLLSGKRAPPLHGLLCVLPVSMRDI